MDDICDIKRYFFLDVIIYHINKTNRCTLKLRMLE